MQNQPMDQDLNKHFVRIWFELAWVSRRRGDTVRILSSYTPLTIKQFKSTHSVDTKAWVFNDYPHSTEQPALGNFYYLFGHRFSQKDWFRLLEYTEEEKLAHILKWGKHD